MKIEWKNEIEAAYVRRMLDNAVEQFREDYVTIEHRPDVQRRMRSEYRILRRVQDAAWATVPPYFRSLSTQTGIPANVLQAASERERES